MSAENEGRNGTLMRDLALSAVAILVGAALLTSALYAWNRAKVVADAQDLVASVASREASMLERCAEAHLVALQALAGGPWQNDENAHDWLSRAWTEARVGSAFAGLAVVDADQRIVAEMPRGTVETDLVSQVMSEVQGQSATVLATQDGHGEPVGVAAVRLPASGRFLIGRIASANWRVFAGSDDGLRGRLIPAEEEKLEGWWKDEHRIYATAWSRPLGVGLAVGMPDEVALRQVRRARTLTWIVFAFLASLMIFCGYYFARRLIVPLKDGAEVASRLAQGDLNVRFKARGPREVQAILSSLERIRAQFADVLGRVRWSAANVADASVKLSSSSQEMSQSSQELASIVQQGRATFEEMEAGIRMTADHASRSKQEIGSAVDVVDRGTDMGQRAASVMKAFVEQAQKMTEIIQVTNEISFQTNLLALNAAVEAARAGEHGRGFAVVANEIRALAQRSAESSKKVKEMIETTLEEIQHGVEETQQLEQLMSEAKSSMAKIAEVMDEISLATKEQAAAVDQVSKSLGQVDEVAQRNAAFVEELASSSEQLAASARDLEQLVSYFKLGQRGPRTKPSLAPEQAHSGEKVQVVENYVMPVGNAPEQPDELAVKDLDGFEEF